MRWIFLIGLVGLMVYGKNSMAQVQLSFEHLTLRHGLSQSVPNHIYQDRKGFIWISTQDGLNRYDGYSFKVFKSNAGDTATLSHSWIWMTCEDRDENLWVATWNGLNRFHQKEQRFIRYPVSGKTGSFDNSRTNIVYCDVRGNVWVGTWGGGLYRYRPESDSFEKIKPARLHPEDLFIRSIYQDAQNRLWVGTFGHGLLEYSYTTNALVVPDDPQLVNERITAITEATDGSLWLGTADRGVRIWKPDKAVQRTLSLPELNDPQITALLTDKDKNIWIGTREGGINLFDQQGNLSHWRHNASDETTIAGPHIFSLFQDRSGIVWIGSTGLSKYDKRRKKFTHRTHHQNVPSTLSAKVIRATLEDSRGRLWIGTEGSGLNQMDNTYRVIRQFKNQPGVSSSLCNNDVRAIVENSDGSLWIGTLGGGLCRLSPETGKTVSYTTRPDFPAIAKNIQHLMLDREGLLWIGTISDGFLWFDTHSDKFIVPEVQVNDTVQISSRYVNRFDEDVNGRIWISGWGGGLSAWNPVTQNLTRYLHNPARTTSLANDIVYCVHRDTKKRLWVGTANGLNLLVKEKSSAFNSFDEEFKLFTEQDGLSNNVVYGILEDDQGKLWLSTNYGLSSFDPETETFKNYHEDDGLQEEEFNANAFYKCADGRLLFGGINGINIFRPEELFINTNIPPVEIVSMKIFEKPITPDYTSPILLKHHQNFISFEFVALDYMAPQRNQFAYRLEGLEEEWVLAGSRRYTTYTNLKPGTYTFRVKASNNDGLWNEQGAALQFTIATPFWITWWFITLLFGILMIILYAIYRYRVNQKLQLERLRTKIAGDLHDEVGSTLTRIALYSDLLQGEVGNSERGQYLKTINEASREVIGTMSDIVWSIDNKSDKLGDLILRLKDFAAQLLPPRDIEVDFTVTGIDEQVVLSPQFKQNIYLVCKEALHNILKHAHATKVIVCMKNSEQGFRLEIADNGIGISDEHGGKGNGLRNMYKRAQEIGAVLQLVNHNGTTLILECRTLN